MPIDARTAVAVAKRAGLTLPDARALAMLTDAEEEATELAAEFTIGVRSRRALDSDRTSNPPGVKP